MLAQGSHRDAGMTRGFGRGQTLPDTLTAPLKKVGHRTFASPSAADYLGMPTPVASIAGALAAAVAMGPRAIHDLRKGLKISMVPGRV